MKSKLLPLTAAMAAVGLLGAGSAHASFILGPFQVEQSATLQSNSSLGASMTVGPGTTPQSLSRAYSGQDGAQSIHDATVPNGNRAFVASAGSQGTVPSADTRMNYDFDLTNISSNAFTGRLRFFLYGLNLRNTCTGEALCVTTDPNSIAGVEITIGTTLPGGGGTASTSQIELGVNGSALNVVSDNLGIAPHMQFSQPGLADLAGGPIFLTVNLGTVRQGETVHIDYDSRNYTNSADGLCDRPPLVSQTSVCEEFGESGSGLTICLRNRLVRIETPQPAFSCTSRLSQFRDPLQGGSVGMEFVDASVNQPAPVPVPASIALLGLGALGLGLQLTRRQAAPRVG